MTVEQLLKKYVPDDVKEFAHAPWNYTVIGPAGLEDEAKLFVKLDIGKTKRIVTLTFDIHITDVCVVQTHLDTPKIKS